MRATSRVKQTEQVLTSTSTCGGTPRSPCSSRRSVCVLTALAARAVRRHLGDRVPYATWTIGESTMWVLALVQLCGAASSPAPGSRGDCPPTGRACVSPSPASRSRRRSTAATRRAPASPWAERLLPTVTIAAIVVAVSSWPTGRMPARWSKPFRLAVLAYVIVGVGSKFVFAGLAAAGSPLVAGAHVGRAHAGGRARRARSGRNVVAVLLHGVAPIVFLAFVVRRRASMPASVRATSRPAFVAAVTVRRLRALGLRVDDGGVRHSAGSADGRRRSGWSVRASRSVATAPSRCCSSGRSR